MVCYSYLFKNFPQFVVIHTVKSFSIINEAEVDVFLEFSWFFLWSNRCGQFQKNIPQPSKRINEKALYLEKPKLVQAKPRYTFSHCSFQGSSNVIFFGNHGPLTSLPPTIFTDEVQDWRRILDAGLKAKESKGVRSRFGVTHTTRGSRTGLKLGETLIF